MSCLSPPSVANRKRPILAAQQGELLDILGRTIDVELTLRLHFAGLVVLRTARHEAFRTGPEHTVVVCHTVCASTSPDNNILDYRKDCEKE